MAAVRSANAIFFKKTLWSGQACNRNSCSKFEVRSSFRFSRIPLKPKKVLWQVPFAHARFSRKPFYEVRQERGTRVLNLKSIALSVRAVEWFQTDRMTDVPI